MKILDRELHIYSIMDIQKGYHRMADNVCQCRRSDAFVYIVSGSGSYHFYKNTETVSGGDVMFLAHQSSYSFTVSAPDFEFIVVNFFFADSESAQLENQLFHNTQTMENVFRKIHALWFKGSFADKLSCKSLLYRIYSEVAEAEVQSYLPMATRSRVQSAIQTLQKSFADPAFSIEELSKQCDITPVHFRRIFKQIHHTSPVKYLISLRVNKAKELLCTTRLPISEVSKACGFNTAYYFAKKFHEIMGMTPSEYRKFINNI